MATSRRYPCRLSIDQLRPDDRLTASVGSTALLLTISSNSSCLLCRRYLNHHGHRHRVVPRERVIVAADAMHGRRTHHQHNNLGKTVSSTSAPAPFMLASVDLLSRPISVTSLVYSGGFGRRLLVIMIGFGRRRNFPYTPHRIVRPFVHCSQYELIGYP